MTDSWSLEVQVLLYFLQLEAISAPDSKRQSSLFSTKVLRPLSISRRQIDIPKTSG
ncbi:hypothetical protein P7K49_029570 [Saguinus oedipus]|uniref:Uncharacterized protein n=1 Tax=Saguinus oedipus TaxID=9490 RepID=A0ABQ9U7L0_SAGOE|nr:hypothetical protein P7K49_029570 [Saguinus oedipus]